MFMTMEKDREEKVREDREGKLDQKKHVPEENVAKVSPIPNGKRKQNFFSSHKMYHYSLKETFSAE